MSKKLSQTKQWVAIFSLLLILFVMPISEAVASAPLAAGANVAAISRSIVKLDRDVNDLRAHNRSMKAYDDYSLSGLKFLQHDTVNIDSLNKLQATHSAPSSGNHNLSDLHNLLHEGAKSKVSDYQRFAAGLYPNDDSQKSVSTAQSEVSSVVNQAFDSVGSARKKQDAILGQLVRKHLSGDWIGKLSAESPTTVQRSIALEMAIGNYLKFQSLRQNQLITLELATQIAEQQKLIYKLGGS